MGEQSENFAAEVEELFSKRIHAFAQWMAKEWALKEDTPDVDMGAEQIEGWNKCCESAEGAAEMWLEEYGY